MFLLRASAATRQLVDDATRLLVAQTGAAPRRLHERVSDAELFRLIGAARREVFVDQGLRAAICSIGLALGFDARNLKFEPPKLRAVVHRGAENPLAAPVYYPHRDTWYAQPLCAINVWLALDDLSEDETFVHYPERFDVAVPNDSADFDYARWGAGSTGVKIGWQDPSASKRAHYPTVVGSPTLGRPVRFSCARGDLLVFSGAHLHATLPQALGTTRYSIDARLIHVGDRARSLGAPNADSACRGDAAVDFADARDYLDG